MTSKSVKFAVSQKKYQEFQTVNGDHPLKSLGASFSVQYRVRRLPDCKVAFFNFELAKEMGLISENHENKSNPELEEEILNAFAIRVINEHDVITQKSYPADTIKPKTFMATRYLQLQHSNVVGKNSGDGRSLWNGSYAGKKGSWDISSCGTGATSLSPAAATLGAPIKTGDKNVSYGCGTADLQDAVAAVLMSEWFYHQEIPTERTLAVLSYGKGLSINIRACPNLLRPAHLFRCLRQNDFETLTTLLDFCLKKKGFQKGNYDEFLNQITLDFSRSAALFERELIFCWFDWDGDNILIDQAGILDYGSIRQFGVYHKDYRYDDGDRWSTSLGEQRLKAREIVQTFIQLIDTVKTKNKKPRKAYKNDKHLKEFDKSFQTFKIKFLLKKVGLKPALIQKLYAVDPKTCQAFTHAYDALEKIQSLQGIKAVPDGKMSFGLFSMSDVLREYPKTIASERNLLKPKEFYDLAVSGYGTPRDEKNLLSHARKINFFQKQYLKLVEAIATVEGRSVDRVLLEIIMRSGETNRYFRVTGNAVIRIADFLIKEGVTKNPTEFQNFLEAFVKRNPRLTKPKLYQKLTEILEVSRDEV